MKIRNGFTMVEVIVVVAILAILATLAIPSFQSSLVRSKVRKTSDLITQMISMAQSEALRRNVKTYMSVVSGALCIGTAPSLCDLRSEPLTSGVSVTSPNLVLSPFYGVPSPAPASFTVSYSGTSQTVSINRMGIVTVGAMQ